MALIEHLVELLDAAIRLRKLLVLVRRMVNAFERMKSSYSWCSGLAQYSEPRSVINGRALTSAQSPCPTPVA